ncbi:hypothetical protein [Cellulomonas triticagri]|uniref:Uncharacterized protein n=1 Tax=Cellulomonas triticagri TaxID=2483352 RepID=A0A3M2ITL4_9CELL|nr:hypothetical protein [Cellulomonas triticagri]RMI03724.1 hypothetical protein EBM89_18570 [Cellulomonas triticagri]
MDDTSNTTRGRKTLAIGIGALVVCGGVIAAAIGWLLHPASTTQDPTPTATVQPTAPAASEDGSGGDGHPFRHGAGTITGTPDPAADAVDATDDALAVAEEWVATFLGWTPEETDATAAAARAQQLAPDARVQDYTGDVLDEAAELGAGAAQPGQVTVVDVSDPHVWPPGWVVLDATVTTTPDAGVGQVVVHVRCEVQVTDGQVVSAVIGDGAAWIEATP